MTTKYNLNDTVFFLHGQKIISGNIIEVFMKAVWTSDKGTRITENYTVEFDIENHNTFDQESEFSVNLLHPSREALIATL